MINDKVNEILINNIGEEFYAKWRRDSWRCLFIGCPGFLIIFITCTFMMYGITWSAVLIMSPPILISLGAFVYSPLIKAKYFNRMIRRISFQHDFIIIETFEWFNNKPIVKSISIASIALKQTDERMFTGKKVMLLKPEHEDDKGYYWVGDFFDQSEGAIAYIKSRLADKG